MEISNGETFTNIRIRSVADKNGKLMTDRDLKERIFQRHDQFDYQRFMLNEKWYLRPTIIMLTSFYMEVNGLFDVGDPVETFSKIYNNYFDFIIYNGASRGNLKCDNCYSEEDGKSVDIDRDFVKREDLYEYISNNNIIRLDVERLKRFISGDELPFTQITLESGSGGTKADVEIDQDVDSVDNKDVKYPVYTGMKFEMLDKKTFDDIKKYYKMLQLEECKWRRAIPIAAKVGLLFYERSIGKPTTRPAFIKQYKQEFDVELKNDTVANYIYDNLPYEYRGGSGAPEKAVDVDVSVVLKAAVYAGSIYDTDDVKDIKKLRAELQENEYLVPSDDILLEIIKATKDI